MQSREIRLVSRPVGLPKPEDFELATVEVGEPGPDQVLVKNLWMSVDPYMRGRMMGLEDSYVAAFQLGAPLEGGAIGRVEASNSDKFKPGDIVSHMLGWREAFVSGADGLTKIDPDLAPPQAFLGALGMPGLTAYAGLLKVGELKDGETVFVSAASGAVGAVVCQIAKAKGCRVVGSAGSDEKCRWLEEVAGIDKAINYKTCGNLEAAVKEACGGGIDVYFENVGGEHLTAALNLMKPFGRIAVCGMISQYNLTSAPEGPHTIINLIPKRIKMQGFIVSDHFDLLGDFFRDMGQWVSEGKMTWKETVMEGIENAPTAFLALFSGDNFGKMLVKLGD